MWYSNSNKGDLSRSNQATRTKYIALLFCITLIAYLLTSCGTKTTTNSTVQSKPAQAPTATQVPTPRPTPTQAPTPRPTPRPQPTQAPAPTVIQAGPAILDLRPASMSIVGHLDCMGGAAFSCQAIVTARAGGSTLNWSAGTNVPGNIGFSPAGGRLAPGASVLITITVPLNACTPGLFFFYGPINTHTITWAC